MVLAADYPFLDVFWTMILFFSWVVWIWMMILILSDIFRRHDISGWAKAAWIVFMIILPFIGVLVYLIAHGKGMAERRAEDQKAAQASFDDYVARPRRTAARQARPARSSGRRGCSRAAPSPRTSSSVSRRRRWPERAGQASALLGAGAYSATGRVPSACSLTSDCTSATSAAVSSTRVWASMRGGPHPDRRGCEPPGSESFDLLSTG